MKRKKKDITISMVNIEIYNETRKKGTPMINEIIHIWDTILINSKGPAEPARTHSAKGVGLFGRSNSKYQLFNMITTTRAGNIYPLLRKYTIKI